MRLIRSAIMRYHATSTSITEQCNASSRRAEAVGHVDVEPELDFARYHMIELQISLMNFSAVTIFLARAVGHKEGVTPDKQCTIAQCALARAADSKATHSTDWCSEIGSLTSLDMHETPVHPVTAENRFHCTRLYTGQCVFRNY